MSQEKVDRYKKEKANRKKIMRKEKIGNAFRKCVIALAAVILVGWIGYSAFNTFEANKEKDKVEIDYTAMSDLQEELAELEESSK